MPADAALEIVHPALPSFTPAGDRIAFVAEASYSLPGKGTEAHIWIVPADGSGPAERLAAGSMPQWSPAGGVLAYLSDEGRPKVQTLQLRGGGGQIVACTGVGGSVEAYAWSADGTRLLALAADVGADRAGSDSATVTGGEAGDDPKVVRPRTHWRRLWEIDAASGEAHVASPDGLNVWEFAWHGGDIAALVSEDPSENGWYDASIVRISDGQVETLHVPELQAGAVTLEPASGAIAFVEALASDRGFLYGPVTVIERDGTRHDLDPQFDVTHVEWRDPSTLICTGLEYQDAAIGVLRLNGSGVHVSAPAEIGGGHLPAFALSPDGTTVAAGFASWTKAPELCTIVLDAAEPRWESLTTMNAGVEFTAPDCEVVRWNAPDGVEIEGLLMTPAGVEGPLPLLVNVHGGPTGAHTWRYPRFREMWATDAGYAMFLPNPRGSTGRGGEFMQMNLGDMGGGDLADILAGVDGLVERGIADGERVGIFGVSYGGFIAAWAVTQTDRFKASMAGAACTNWISFHNTSNIARFDENFLLADPYDPSGDYVNRSPVLQIRGTTTPVLVIHGELDLCVPLSQGQELHHALVGEGVESELVIYPREGHGWTEREHQLDSARRMRDWFDRHLSV
jgi:dipeptidyl aminopeptidase/acylaminoacyl peptidase